MSKKILRALLVPFEYVFSLFNNWKPIPNSDQKVFLIDIHKYKGKEYLLKDNTVIKKGDLVAELHVNNTHVIDLDNSMANLYNLIDCELKLIAKALNKEYKDIKAFYCETVLYALISRKGFQTFKLTNSPITKLKGFWYRTLKDTFSSSRKPGKKRLPRKCFISAEKLKQMYDK